ncbi:MAG: hypothetical protein A2Y69_05155 [Candidatus Aminicenantes bacterium RBG_13_59_9]|jgi:hypothetical protein|nr:MAG: hypothetical protein A2Y69_05155 [Candidatus Aminicenantes bacterium RBG_13_59_9]
MYLGIDFLVTPELRPLVVEVNVGLPGGAQEHDLTSLVHTGRPSGVFGRIEKVSHEVYGKPFREYLQSLPWLNSLKPFKIWMDGEGPFPQAFHPALRFEDKWVQYQILSSRVPMPETVVCDPSNISEAGRFLSRKGRLVGKRRLGRGGRDFKLIDSIGDLAVETTGPYGRLFQEWVDSRVASYVFSIRSIAFGGEHICAYANLAAREYSNHGVLAYVESGRRFGLSADDFTVRSFNQRSWEAEIWFGRDEPDYLRHNLYEDEVAAAALVLPGELMAAIQDISVRIERFYESLDPASLPRAFFE